MLKIGNKLEQCYPNSNGLILEVIELNLEKDTGKFKVTSKEGLTWIKEYEHISEVSSALSVLLDLGSYKII